MLKKFNIATLVLLAVTLTGAPLCHADTRDADLVKQGIDALKRKDYDTAVARLSDAIRLVPDDAEAWGARGEAHARKGDSALALSDCAESLKLAPGSSDVYRRCGNIHYIAGDYRSAIANYDVAIQLDPNSAVVYLNRGIAYSRLEQTDRSVADYDEALKLDPSQSNAHAWRGYAWWQKGDFDRAWDDFNRAIEADPKNAFAFFSRGYAAASRYDYDDAIADYDKAISLDPTYKDAYRYRDDALRHKSDARWGYLNLVLIGIGMVAALFAAFRAYASPTGFSHSVDRHFKHMPDGRLLFYPRMKGAGYVVPDAKTEQDLRVFTKDSRAGAIAFGVLGPVLMCALIPIVWPVLTWLQSRFGISSNAAIFISSFGTVALILGGGLIAFSSWRRAATRGLEQAEERGGPLEYEQLTYEFVEDMPPAVRWIALAVMAFLLFQSFKGLWRWSHDLSLAHLELMPWFGWMAVATNFFVLWYCGKLLIYAIRERGRRARSSEKPA
jgi:tetratricopeptide (TPR) repeat protein